MPLVRANNFAARTLDGGPPTSQDEKNAHDENVAFLNIVAPFEPVPPLQGDDLTHIRIHMMLPTVPAFNDMMSSHGRLAWLEHVQAHIDNLEAQQGEGFGALRQIGLGIMGG